MATVDGASLRKEFEAARAGALRFIRKDRVAGQVDAEIGVLFPLLELSVDVMPEGAARCIGGNSGIPPSQMQG